MWKDSRASNSGGGGLVKCVIYIYIREGVYARGIDDLRMVLTRAIAVSREEEEFHKYVWACVRPLGRVLGSGEDLVVLPPRSVAEFPYKRAVRVLCAC